MKKRLVSVLTLMFFMLVVLFSTITRASVVINIEAFAQTNKLSLSTNDEIIINLKYFINGRANNFDDNVPMTLEYQIQDGFKFVSASLPNCSVTNNKLTANGLSKQTGSYVNYQIKLKATKQIDLSLLNNLGEIKILYKPNNGNGQYKTATTRVLISKINGIIKEDTTNLNFSAYKNKQELYKDEQLEVTFKVDPQGKVSITRNPLSLILVMDTSGSMRENNKMQKSKEAAKRLVDLFAQESLLNDKIGLVDFDTYVNDGSYKIPVYFINQNRNNYKYEEWSTKYYVDYLIFKEYFSNCNELVSLQNKEQIKYKINRMFAYGGTNLESALIKARQYFNQDSNEKHIIVLTDGNPTFYNSRNNSGSLIIQGLGSGYDSTAAEEAKNVLRELKDNNVSVHFLALKTQPDDINDAFLQEAANIGGGMKYITDDVEKIDPLMQDIMKVINKSVVYNDLKFEYTVPSGLEINTNKLPQGFRVESMNNGQQKIVGDLSSIEFKNNEQIEPQARIFKLYFKPKTLGNINLGIANLSYKKNSFLGEFEGNLEVELNSIQVKDYNVGLGFNVNKNKEELYIDEELELNYEIIPQGILQIQRKPVSIIFIMDTSGSMAQLSGSEVVIDKNNINYSKTKMYYSVNAAKNLLDLVKLNKVDGDRIGLIDYDSIVQNNNSSQLLDVNDNSIQNLKIKIDNMKAEGGTNLQAALIKAKYYFSDDNNEKYIILLTDGMPSQYYNDNNQVVGIGYTYDEEAGRRANNVAEELKNMGVKINILAVDTEGGVIREDYINNLAQNSDGSAYFASKTEQIDEMLKEIYKTINKSIIYDDIKIIQNIPNGVDVVSYPTGWEIKTVNNNKVLEGKIDKVVFENNSGITPPSSSFKVKVKAKREGLYDFGKAMLSANIVLEGNKSECTPIEKEIGTINFKIKNFYEYIQFQKMELKRNLIPNNTYATLSIKIGNKKDLFEMDPDAKVELILTPITDGDIETTKDEQQNNFLFNASAESRSDRFKFRITNDNVKDKEVTLRVTAIKVTYKGVEYNITQDIYKYFGNETPSISVMVKKFTLR